MSVHLKVLLDSFAVIRNGKSGIIPPIFYRRAGVVAKREVAMGLMDAFLFLVVLVLVLLRQG